MEREMELRKRLNARAPKRQKDRPLMGRSPRKIAISLCVCVCVYTTGSCQALRVFQLYVILAGPQGPTVPL